MKNCRNGVREPTFKGNECRCFIYGYTTDIELIVNCNL